MDKIVMRSRCANRNLLRSWHQVMKMLDGIFTFESQDESVVL